MNRRTFIGAWLSMTLAGCSNVENLLESEKYEEGDEGELLPDSVGSDWPDDDLRADHDLNDNFDRVWITPDEDLFVLMGVRIYSTIDDAKDGFQRAQATASDPRDYPLADEAFISDDGETARCAFRHSNGIGQVLSARRSGLELQPDRQRTTTYAELMFEEWK